MEAMGKGWGGNLFLLGCFALLGGLYIRWSGPEARAAGWDTDGIAAVAEDHVADWLVLVDTKRKTICMYQTQGTGMFRLMTARSYQYDVQLKNTAGQNLEKSGATFREAKELYEQQTKRNEVKKP
jgi:hypothetical protein